ncbi:MAG TPA: hypothetical protein VGH33_28255, partial [Isosphaeraceae bacterium]
MATATRLLPAFLMGAAVLGQAAALTAQDPKDQAKSAANPKSEAKSKAAAKPKAPRRYSVPPTYANVPYGDHERQVLDFFKADTKEPAPLVVYIHGGGWVNGDKGGINAAMLT